MNRPIILVEDNPNDALLVQRLFERSHVNHRLITFEVGGDAILYFENAANPLPCVVLLDLNLPDMSGFDVLYKIRNDARLKDLCVFVFTISEDQETVARAYKHGADSYLRKPLNIGQLLIELQKHCNVGLDIGKNDSTD